MDNTIIPYQDASDSSSEEDLDSSDSDDEHSQLLSNNIGVIFNKFQTDAQFMNMEDPKEYLIKRNKLFTPEISKKIFTVSLNALSTSFTLEDDIKLPTKNIIGFKILKSNFVGNGTDHNTDLSIPEIPPIACDKSDTGENLIARIPLRKVTSDFYTHQFLELSLIDRYFFPQALNTLTFNLSVNVQGFVVIELSYLNETN